MRHSPYESKATEAAESLAFEILGFLARDSERLGGFLAATGVGPEAIRDMAHEPAFLRGVIDYLLADEALLLVFCEEYDHPPNRVWAARRLLGGDEAEGAV